VSLTLHPDVTRLDFAALPEQFRKAAVRILLALRDDPFAVDASVALRPSRVALDLSGCRSLRFGGEAYDDAFRVVFEVEESGDIRVLAVGPRQASEVFRVAQDRLRPPAPRRLVRPAHNRRTA